MMVRVSVVPLFVSRGADFCRKMNRMSEQKKRTRTRKEEQEDPVSMNQSRGNLKSAAYTSRTGARESQFSTHSTAKGCSTKKLHQNHLLKVKVIFPKCLLWLPYIISHVLVVYSVEQQVPVHSWLVQDHVNENHHRVKLNISVSKLATVILQQCQSKSGSLTHFFLAHAK